MAPHTAASNPIFTFLASAASKIDLPRSAKRALLAVTRCFPELRISRQRLNTKSLFPPIVSTTRSISSEEIISRINSLASVPVRSLPPPQNKPIGRLNRSEALTGESSTIFLSTIWVLALIERSRLISVMICATPPPTVPQPRMAMFNLSIS